MGRSRVMIQMCWSVSAVAYSWRELPREDLGASRVLEPFLCCRPFPPTFFFFVNVSNSQQSPSSPSPATLTVQDHSPRSLLVQEGGGIIISDLKGRPLDFGLGRTLGENYVVVARKEVHAQVIEAIQAVLTLDEEGGPNPGGNESAEVKRFHPAGVNRGI
jgi:hypothetical protein